MDSRYIDFIKLLKNQQGIADRAIPLFYIIIITERLKLQSAPDRLQISL